MNAITPQGQLHYTTEAQLRRIHHICPPPAPPPPAFTPQEAHVLETYYVECMTKEGLTNGKLTDKGRPSLTVTERMDRTIALLTGRPHSAAQIGEALMITRGAAAQCLATLQSKGQVVRDPVTWPNGNKQRGVLWRLAK